MKIRNLLLILFTLIILNSCNRDYKVCECNSKNEEIKIYNNILTELVEHYFQNRYLGADGEKIADEFISYERDSIKIEKLQKQFQNKLFNDTSKFCNIYLDTIYKPKFYNWSYYQIDTGRFSKEKKKLISSFSDDGQQVIDSLNSVNLKLKAKDFKLCTSKVLSIREFNKQNDRCYIGTVSFSKIFLDRSKMKGLLYCSFRCGGLCGEGLLLIIEKLNDRWIIKNSELMWIS